MPKPSFVVFVAFRIYFPALLATLRLCLNLSPT